MTQEELIKEITQLPLGKREALLDELSHSVAAEVERRLRLDEIVKSFRASISREDFEIFVRQTFDGLSVEQIAEELNTDTALVRFRLNTVRARIRMYLKRTGDPKKEETNLGERSTSASNTQTLQRDNGTLSQRLRGILEFDGEPPNDEEVKGMISDYLIRKYS